MGFLFSQYTHTGRHFFWQGVKGGLSLSRQGLILLQSTHVTHVPTHTHTHTPTHTNTHNKTHTQTRHKLTMHTHAQAHIHRQTCMYTHTQTNTHTHAQSLTIHVHTVERSHTQTISHTNTDHTFFNFSFLPPVCYHFVCFSQLRLPMAQL